MHAKYEACTREREWEDERGVGEYVRIARRGSRRRLNGYLFR